LPWGWEVLTFSLEGEKMQHFKTNRRRQEQGFLPTVNITLEAEVKWEPEPPDNIGATAKIIVEKTIRNETSYKIEAELPVVVASQCVITPGVVLNALREADPEGKIDSGAFDDDPGCIERMSYDDPHYAGKDELLSLCKWIKKTLNYALPVARDIMDFHSVQK
jgi:hypothetical protein